MCKVHYYIVYMHAYDYTSYMLDQMANYRPLSMGYATPNTPSSSMAGMVTNGG